jgi:hypothetical protein
LLPFLARGTAQNRQATRKGKHAHKNQKTNEKTQQKNKWKRARKGNKNSEADSFRNIKVKHHTHLKMAM